MTKDDIKEYVVCINGGSGVIFQPMDSDWSYILTAKHVFDDIAEYSNAVNIDMYNSEQNMFVQLPPFQLETNNYFPHSSSNVDAAILKVARLMTRDKMIVSEVFTKPENAYVSGFPEVRRQSPINSDCWRLDEIKEFLQTKENGQIEAKLERITTHEELKGQSGGGLFKINHDLICLLGVQNQIPVEDSHEQLGHIEFTPIATFNQIVEESNGELEIILPCYMKNFSFLKDNAFKLEVDAFDDGKITFVRNFLKNKAYEVIGSNVVPLKIKKLFENRLLVNNREKDVLCTQTIWRIWLEFLTIINIAKSSAVDEMDIFDIFNSFCLKYSDTKGDWTYLIKEELQYSDYMGLNNNATVFIGTSLPARNTLIIPKDKIRSIATVYDRGKFMTNKGIDPYTSFSFVHTDYLHKTCILDKLNKYADITDEATLLQLLKEEYNELFKFE